MVGVIIIVVQSWALVAIVSGVVVVVTSVTELVGAGCFVDAIIELGGDVGSSSRWIRCRCCRCCHCCCWCCAVIVVVIIIGVIIISVIGGDDVACVHDDIVLNVIVLVCDCIVVVHRYHQNRDCV